MKAPDHTFASVAQIADFDAIIDVRSPSEFAEDRIPGAINCPVLDDEERIRVGTLYKQVSPFEARKVGAVLVARNIARHIETHFSGHSKSWRPLVYCWRGGQRSGAFTHILGEIGWSARRLEGGYKQWRHHVLNGLASLPTQLQFKVVAGPTGSGKSRLLEAMARQGAQVLHLEALAAHKGSVLGNLPGAQQPSQKHFDTCLYSALSQFDPARPVFVESESRRIGLMTLPDALVQAIASSPVIRIDVDIPARVEFLLRDYDYLCNAERLGELLPRLKEIQGKEVIQHWKSLAEANDFRTLVSELLERHYDPLYSRSLRRQLQGTDEGMVFHAKTLTDADIERLANAVLVRVYEHSSLAS